MIAGTLKRDLKDVTAECNPALRPICSYENPHLVRYLYKVSLSLSGKVSKQLRMVHGSKGPVQSVLKPLVVQVNLLSIFKFSKSHDAMILFQHGDARKIFDNNMFVFKMKIHLLPDFGLH